MTRLGVVSIVFFLFGSETASALAGPRWEWSNVSRIVAMGDVHGRYDELVLILKTNGLVDDDLQWTGGHDHLVLCGDLIDRGPSDRAVLDLVMRLEKQAEAAGGRVHALLGNHEVMNLMRDLRYVRMEGFAEFADDDDGGEREREWNEYRRMYRRSRDLDALRAAFDEDYPPGYFARVRAFSKGGVYGDWILSHPVIVKINRTLFLHGGLTEKTAKLGLDALNDAVRVALEEFVSSMRVLEVRVAGPADFRSLLQFANRASSGGADTPRMLANASRRLLLQLESLGFLPGGPLWYRGNALANERAGRAELDAVLKALDADQMMVGHSATRTGRITSRFKGRLFRGDVGLGYGRDGLALVLDEDGATVVDARTGARTRPDVEPPQGQDFRGSIVHMPDVLVEAILRDGDVNADTGLTLGDAPVVEIERGTLKLRAVFKSSRTSNGSPERELAAYLLDREFGLDFVPVVVKRRVDGRSGVLRPLLEDAVDLVSLRSYRELENMTAVEIVNVVADFYETDSDELLEQVVEAWVFDALIGKVARPDYQGLFIPAEGRIALVDHDDAFSTTTEVDPGLEELCPLIPPDAVHGLRILDLTTLQPLLGELLASAEIDAILVRRNRVLAMCGLDP